jgi:hypothetical protein
MNIILLPKEEYDEYVLANADADIFDAHDNYRFHTPFDIYMTRDQIRLQIEEYNAKLIAGAN